MEQAINAYNTITISPEFCTAYAELAVFQAS